MVESPSSDWVAEPHRIDGIGRAIDLSLGGFHGCVREEDGRVACWGGNGWGQLGDGRREEHRARAERVDLPGPARWIATSMTASCASLEGGETWCWGATSKDAGRIRGEKCSGGLFGPTRTCASTPARMDLPKTAAPIATPKVQ